MNNVLASRLSQIFGNSLPLMHNYNFPVFEMAPLGKKQARNQVNHNIYALSMLQQVYIMNFLSLNLFFFHCFLCPALSSHSFIHCWETNTLQEVAEKLHKLN